MGTLVEISRAYFISERNVGIALAVVGVACGLFALWVHRQQMGPFGAGLMWPLAVFALLATLGGAGLAWRSAGQVESMPRGFTAARATTIAAEKPRMVKVMALWPRAKLVWTILTVLALIMLMGTQRAWANGAGLALLVLTTTLFFVDVFGERRAAVYAAALESDR